MQKLHLFVVALTLVAFIPGPAMAQSDDQAQQPQHQHSMAQASDMHEAHHHDVNRRGDVAMGFSHMKTTHHFRLSSSGGSIEVQVNDPKDSASRAQIQQHLEQLPQSFRAGNFSAPMETHGRTPPGVTTLQQLKSDINYTYVPTDLGGKVLISTANPKAVEAVHAFLRFQIEDHRTGDPLTLTK